MFIVLCLPVCAGDGGKAGSAALAGGGSRSRQGGTAQPAGGGEEVGALTSLFLDFTDVRNGNFNLWPALHFNGNEL